jgi:hypothetical protein
VRLLGDVFLKNLALCGLRVPKVHHFVHKLIYYHEVVAYTLLFQFLEVLNKNLDKPMQKDDDFSSVAVSLREGEYCNMSVSQYF